MKKFISLGLFLKQCPYVITLGVKPQFSAYEEAHRKLLFNTSPVLFPTSKYTHIFKAVGKATFPSASSHYFKRHRPLQWYLASYIDLPRLRTRLYIGKNKSESILKDFGLPVRILNIRNDRSEGEVANTREELDRLLYGKYSVMAQEVAEYDELVEVVFIFYKLCGYRFFPERKSPEILTYSYKIVREAFLDDISIRWVCKKGKWYFGGMDFPPQHFLSPEGERQSRKDFLCNQLQRFLT